MKSKDKIQRLIQELSEASTSNYTNILNNFNFNLINFKPYESWSDIKYTRNCIYRDEHFELLLLCWKEDQETSIHCHGGEDCWVYLLEGELEEVFYTLDSEEYLREIRSHNVEKDQLTFMNDNIGFHKLRNTCKTGSLSLHLYAKPIENCRFYDETSLSFVSRNLSYDTISEENLVGNID